MSRKTIVKYDYLQSLEISRNTALSFIQQSLIYDSRPDQKWSLKKIS